MLEQLWVAERVEPEEHLYVLHPVYQVGRNRTLLEGGCDTTKSHLLFTVIMSSLLTRLLYLPSVSPQAASKTQR